ncbi:MAG: VacJ family lipoprotein [Sphingomonas sp.]|jgi:phospholipid-binding lipoprotein MlaA|uniref:MlaA family lipoprotein n=1 Tax=Sphingomonas sp. TaxID=28214 RepID=UPI0025ED11D2|nr:VacJ family lipoprotein [Sphingomonas sp.]MBX9881701.1 VacJ family lipoprotein [Sphingomonas sp.]
MSLPVIAIFAVLPAPALPPQAAPAVESTAAPAGLIPPPAVPAPPVPVVIAGTPQAAESGQQDIVVEGSAAPPKSDPMQQVNQVSFAATQAVDKAFFGPVALGYQKAVPRPVRTGIRNFLRNVGEPVVFVNYLLQFKPGKAAETVGRFLINSTAGVAGFLDVAVAKPFRLPYRPNGFANTLAIYGVGPGPYLFLPLIGPTTVRDLFGRGVDAAVLPLSIGFPFDDLRYNIPANALRSIDYRAEFDGDYVAVRADPNPYKARRELYLAYRQAQIDRIRGKVKMPDDQLLRSTAPVPPAQPAPR